MNRQQFEALEESIKSIARSDRDYVRLYDDNGELTIIFDGDFTVDELRQIVAACDAAIGTTQAVEGGQEVYLEHLYHYHCEACKRWWTVADIPPVIGVTFTCPHCGHAGNVGSIKTAENK